MITDEELNVIEQRLNGASEGPWTAFIEGRDHESGSHFIMTGTEKERGKDFEIIGATIADYDFIANARQDIPKLLRELRELKNK